MPRNVDKNVIRNKVLEDFSFECLSSEPILDVAVVGGSLDDPEVHKIRDKDPNVKFCVLGIEDSQVFLDLNESSSIGHQFDLVLVTNVLEHIYHHENFAKNLLRLLRDKGTLWCCFPFNDMFHGSPYYYSAGFHPEYVEKLFERNGGIVQKSRIIASKRCYLFTHLLRDWPSEFRYKHPFLGQIIWGLGLRRNPRPPINNLSPQRLLKCVYLSLVSKKFTDDPNFGVSSWVKVHAKRSAIGN